MAYTLMRSNEQLNLARNINLDESTSSSDAGDVLIRSTRIHFPEQSYDRQRDSASVSTVSNRTEQVKITVKKLRDVTEPSLASDEPPVIDNPKQTKKQKHHLPDVPPPLRANLPSVSHSGEPQTPLTG